MKQMLYYSGIVVGVIMFFVFIPKWFLGLILIAVCAVGLHSEGYWNGRR